MSIASAHSVSYADQPTAGKLSRVDQDLDVFQLAMSIILQEALWRLEHMAAQPPA